MKKLILFLIIIILLLIIGFMVYAFISIKPVLDKYKLEEVTENGETITAVVDKHPLLTDSQEKTLESIGIDPAKLPTAITPAMEECFVNELGQDRVSEIKQGATPGLTDFYKAKSCL